MRVGSLIYTFTRPQKLEEKCEHAKRQAEHGCEAEKEDIPSVLLLTESLKDCRSFRLALKSHLLLTAFCASNKDADDRLLEDRDMFHGTAFGKLGSFPFKPAMAASS